MPSTLLKSFAKRARVPMDRAGRLWEKAKERVKEQYKLDAPKGGPEATRYWKLVVGVTKKMLSLESSPTPIDPELIEGLRGVGLEDVADELEGV